MKCHNHLDKSEWFELRLWALVSLWMLNYSMPVLCVSYTCNMNNLSVHTHTVWLRMKWHHWQTWRSTANHWWWHACIGTAHFKRHIKWLTTQQATVLAKLHSSSSSASSWATAYNTAAANLCLTNNYVELPLLLWTVQGESLFSVFAHFFPLFSSVCPPVSLNSPFITEVNKENFSLMLFGEVVPSAFVEIILQKTWPQLQLADLW